MRRPTCPQALRVLAKRTLIPLAAAVLALAGTTAQAQEKSLTVFIGPTPLYDAVWMADAKGYFAEEGLKVDYRLFPSGTTALQTFQSGQGDLVMSGELPGLRYWTTSQKDYRVVSLLERNYQTYRIMARKDVKQAADLRGKTVATRVGSTGSWFVSEYLRINNVPEGEVSVKNLDTQVLPTALCRGDIDAFFIWEPFATRAQEICPNEVHSLGDAKGYINGYALMGARASWLATPEGADKATRFLRAVAKGRPVAEKDFEAVAAYAKAKHGMSEEATRAQWSVNNRVSGFDETFYKDHCSLADWMRKEKLMTGPFDAKDYIWTDGLSAVDPKLVSAPPAPC